MNRFLLKNTVAKCLFLITGSLMAGSAAFASNWVGTADYTNAPSATGDEWATNSQDAVGPFDTYDFGNGVGAIVSNDPSFSVGSTFTGFYQTYLTRHELGGKGINLAQLDATGGTDFNGVGDGFELTLQATFQGTYVSNSSGLIGFQINPGGFANLYFDTTPDYSFIGDSGFGNAGNDGDILLSGAINGGSGTLVTGAGFGVSQLIFSGAFGTSPANIYSPNTIDGGNALFTINLSNSAVLAGVSSVMGNTTNLYSADGSLQLTAVPLPGAMGLFLTGVMGLASVRKHKRIV